MYWGTFGSEGKPPAAVIMAQIAQATAIARITCKYRLCGVNSKDLYMILLQVQLSPKDSNQIQANWTSQILVCRSIFNLDNKTTLPKRTALPAAAIAKLHFTSHKNSVFYHSRKRIFSKAAADTFRVYEFDVSFVFNSCKRTPEMKAPSHLNLLIFMNF